MALFGQGDKKTQISFFLFLKTQFFSKLYLTQKEFVVTKCQNFRFLCAEVRCSGRALRTCIRIMREKIFLDFGGRVVVKCCHTPLSAPCGPACLCFACQVKGRRFCRSFIVFVCVSTGTRAQAQRKYQCYDA